MTKRLTHVAPLQLGTVLAVTYALISLIFVPFFLVFMMIGASLPQQPGTHVSPLAVFGGSAVLMAVVLPIMYGVLGFIGGVIAGFVYNLVAGWTGGIEFTTTDVPPAIPVQTTTY